MSGPRSLLSAWAMPLCCLLAGGAAVSASAPMTDVRVPWQTSELIDSCEAPAELSREMTASMFNIISRSTYAALPERHKEMIASYIARGMVDEAPVQACFAPGTDDAIMTAFNQVVNSGRFYVRYNANSRWNNTAITGNTGAQGDPITLTWSIAPDGTPIPNGVGEGDGVSNLRARLDQIYGSEAVWLPLFQQVFDRWSQLSGITYVYESNDDGITFNNNPGVVGVRGDVRIGGKLIDGNSGVLAYNSFPQSGDMVIDTGDNFYDNTTNGSLRLRNVLSHEHGHGLGFAHTCPIEQTKLMEPFLTVAFDGPRHDDIRGVQRSYGDPSEPDNTAAQATDLGTPALVQSVQLGTVPGQAVSLGSVLSIDADGEQDWFRFTTTGPRRVSITLQPIGTTYDDSDQACSGSSGSCCSGNVIDSLRAANLAVQLIGPNGSTLLATADCGASGVIETLNAPVAGAGDYFIRVYETDSPTQSQLYQLNLLIEDLTAAPLTVTIPSPPTQMNAGQATSFAVQVNLGADTIVPGTPRLRYRYDGGAYLITPLTPPVAPATTWTATLPPALCTSNPEFFVEIQGSLAGIVTAPEACRLPLTASVGTPISIANVNFETAAGWTVSNGPTLTDGGWDRGVPVACTTRGAPGTDFDGSGQCFLTDNSAASGCNSDVDGGTTTVSSPIYNLAGVPDATVSYARWYNNSAGASPQQDIFTVQVSSDGGTNWVNLEVVGPTNSSPNPEVAGGWFQKSFRVGDFVPLTNNFRIRFIAEDLDPGSVVEAGVDAFSITGRQCVEPCRADFNGANGITVQDIFDFLSAWNSNNPTADYNGVNGITVQDIFDFLTDWNAGCQ
jgi:hypothetical protein